MRAAPPPCRSLGSRAGPQLAAPRLRSFAAAARSSSRQRAAPGNGPSGPSGSGGPPEQPPPAASGRPRVSWRGSSSSSARGAPAAGAPAPARSGGADADADAGPPLYRPAAPAPAFFLPQVSSVGPRETEAFLMQSINRPNAYPVTAEENERGAEQAAAVMQAVTAERRRQLPQAYQSRLAASAAAAEAALAAARSRPGGLSPAQAELADHCAKVVAATSQPMVAELGADVLQALAAGQTPDEYDVGVLLDPMTLLAEDVGCTGPEWDEMFFRAAEGLPAHDDMQAAVADDLYELFSCCPDWTVLHQLVLDVVESDQLEVLEMRHLLVLLQRLPMLAQPAQLGFQQKLAWEQLLGTVLVEVDRRADDLAASPAATAAVAVALGRLGTPGELLTATLTRTVDEHLAAFSVRQLADVVWGLAKAGQDVPPAWLERVWLEMGRKRRERPLDTLSLAKALYASSLLGQRPPEQLLRPLVAACTRHAGAFSVQQLANTLAAVARLQLRPPPSWLAALLAALTEGQFWSGGGSDGHSISFGSAAGPVRTTRQAAMAEAAAAASGAAERSSGRDAAVEAAVAAAAAAAASGACAPPAVAAAAAAALPYLYQWPQDGPTPCSINSTAFYWTHLLSSSYFGGSSSAVAQSAAQGLPLVLPPAPLALLSLQPEQLAELAQALAALVLAPEDAAVAGQLEQLQAAAAGVAAQRGDRDASTVLVSELLVAGAQKQQQQQQAPGRQPLPGPQQRASGGFGGSARRKPSQVPPGQQRRRQQQQQQQQAALDPALVAEFDAATGGLWQQAIAGGWTLGELAAAAARNSSEAAAAAAAAARFMEAWFDASQALLPQTEPAFVVAMLRAVAALSAPGGARLGLVAAGQPGASPQHGQLAAPPASWLAAAVARLSVVRSACAEFALFHALQALSQLLMRHPQRGQLLAQQPEPSQQPWRWWHNFDGDATACFPSRAAAVAADMRAAEESLTEAPVSAAPADMGAAREQLRQAAATLDTAGDSWPGHFSSAGGRRLRAGSWLFAAPAASGGGAGGASVASIHAQLQVLVGCLGSELGTQLEDVQLLVEEAECISALSPSLLDAPWLARHEAALLRLLQSKGMSPGASERATAAAAADAGLLPGLARRLLRLHAACGYEMRHAGLLRMCQRLAAA